MKYDARMFATSIAGIVVLCAILFLPAGTLNYWQGWAFIASFTAVTIAPTLYLARTDPAALQRRTHAGPRAETRPVQKFAITASFLMLFAMMAFSAFDHRMRWSPVPPAVSVIGNVLVAVGIGLAMLTIVQNSYAASNVVVEAGQTLASGGLYGIVRHPMYVGDVIMMVGVPLALGSYWGLLFVVAGLAVLVMRILDEEKLLTAELPGYREYTQRVRYRLLPYVW